MNKGALWCPKLGLPHPCNGPKHVFLGSNPKKRPHAEHQPPCVPCGLTSYCMLMCIWKRNSAFELILCSLHGLRTTRWLASMFILYILSLADFFTFQEFCTIPTWTVFTFLRRNSILATLPNSPKNCLNHILPDGSTLFGQYLWKYMPNLHQNCPNSIARCPHHMVKLGKHIPYNLPGSRVHFESCKMDSRKNL